MRGGAQGQLMLGADGHLYVVKFQNNAQHIRVLANELIATRLAEQAGLTVPQCDVVEVTPWLIANTPELVIEERSRRVACAAGLQFGSRFVGGLMPGQVVDYLPEERLGEVRNLAEFAGMLAIDKWTCNSNGRQAVFERKARERKYKACFIDQGFCFHAGEWSFPDAPLRGVYARNRVYAGVTGWDSFEPWLTRVETMEAGKLWTVAEAVPPEWYGGDTAVIERLMEQLMARRGKVRELIVSFRDSGREPFPNWREGVKVVVGRQFEDAVVAHDGKWLM
ncbi:MAG: HipA family kinase [Acidobacteriaceae bacterium]